LDGLKAQEVRLALITLSHSDEARHYLAYSKAPK